MEKIRALFAELEKMPFPPLGKNIGDFPLYESLLAGTVASFLEGRKLTLEEIPAPDAETEKGVCHIKEMGKLDKQQPSLLNISSI